MRAHKAHQKGKHGRIDGKQARKASDHVKHVGT